MTIIRICAFITIECNDGGSISICTHTPELCFLHRIFLVLYEEIIRFLNYKMLRLCVFQCRLEHLDFSWKHPSISSISNKCAAVGCDKNGDIYYPMLVFWRRTRAGKSHHFNACCLAKSLCAHFQPFIFLLSSWNSNKTLSLYKQHSLRGNKKNRGFCFVILLSFKSIRTPFSRSRCAPSYSVLIRFTQAEHVLQ